jgi:pimeloyl-ACP methyl ester carboxylesterase
MNFHTFGNKEGSAVILIHGMLTPWQIWNKAAEEFSGTHYVIVPELDGHTENEKSTVISIEDEAQKICGYIKRELGGEVFLLAGLSMGGMQTINIGLCECLDLFSAFGAFSAAPSSRAWPRTAWSFPRPHGPGCPARYVWFPS